VGVHQTWLYVCSSALPPYVFAGSAHEAQHASRQVAAGRWTRSQRGSRHGGCLAGGMFYGPRVFDPVLIIAQIVVLQCLWYISLGCLLWLLLGAPPAPACTASGCFWVASLRCCSLVYRVL
jgi:Integral membrane protein S linking to the trans Golgi network